MGGIESDEKRVHGIEKDDKWETSMFFDDSSLQLQYQQFENIQICSIILAFIGFCKGQVCIFVILLFIQFQLIVHTCNWFGIATNHPFPYAATVVWRMNTENNKLKNISAIQQDWDDREFVEVRLC